MRLRVLVGAAGHPRPVSPAPFDVLENGVAAARWTVADASEDDQLNDARATLLRALQARAGTPARPLRQVLVRLPRRLSGPLLHGGPLSTPIWEQEEGRLAVERGNLDGWAEVIRWLRGLPPTPPERPSGERNRRARELVNVDFVPACWELSYQGAGLGLPSPQRYPCRTRSRRGRSHRQREREVLLGLRPPRLRGQEVTPAEVDRLRVGGTLISFIYPALISFIYPAQNKDLVDRLAAPRASS